MVARQVKEICKFCIWRKLTNLLKFTKSLLKVLIYLFKSISPATQFSFLFLVSLTILITKSQAWSLEPATLLTRDKVFKKIFFIKHLR